MSTVIRSCPGCKSLILSDTDQCPECGHVFYERKKTESSGVSPATPDALKSASMQEPCPHCGEMVRSGLVRCWSCNQFMRADVAARYRQLTTNPQPIIYSTISAENRKDFLPPRAEPKAESSAKVVDNDDFKLGSGVDSVEADDFEVGSGVKPVTPPSAPSKIPAVLPPEKPIDGPDKPESTTKVTGKSKVAGTASEPQTSGGAAAAEVPADSPAPVQGTSRNKGGEDDLLSFAVEEQKEGKKRKNQKNAERLRKQVLVPCTCGAWIRVNEDQAGKILRCKQCKQPVVVPGLKKKAEKQEKPAAKVEAAAVQKTVSWIDDAWFHVLSPAALVLKPGSLTGKHTEVDIAFDDSGLHILTFAGTKKKRSIFSFGAGNKKADHQARRLQIREQVAKTGNFENLENVEIRKVEGSRAGEVRLVQPVAKVSESMFAGVPVFGEGRIAIFLPLEIDGGKQAFLSFSISGWRVIAEQFKSLFGTELNGTENGIPESDKAETLSCFMNQSRIESVKGLIYYQKDTAYTLELSGHKCKSCGTTISEEARKAAKLGGVKGKGIAKAKCPKCSNKMQAESLYKIAKGPDTGNP